MALSSFLLHILHSQRGRQLYCDGPTRSSGRYSTIDPSEALGLSRLVHLQEHVEPKPLAATWAVLDPLAVGSAGLIGVEESQGAQIHSLTYHFAGDGVTARAMPRGQPLSVALRQECPTEAVLRPSVWR